MNLLYLYYSYIDLKIYIYEIYLHLPIMINFLGLRNILFNENPWEKLFNAKKSHKKNKKAQNSGNNSEKEPSLDEIKDNEELAGKISSEDENEINNEVEVEDSNTDNEVKEESEEVESSDTIASATNNDKELDEDKDEKDDSNTIVGPWGNIKKTNIRSENNSNKARYDNIIQDLMQKKSPNSQRGGGFGGGSNNNSSGGGNFFNNLEQSPKKLFGIIILVIASLWLSTGFYKVNSDENAIVLYFGKYHTLATPGLNYHIPFPVGKIVKQSVTTVNSEEFGYNSSTAPSRIRGRRSASNAVDSAENLMLTGDENIVDIEFQVQWQIKDIEKFTFNISEPRQTIRKSAQSAMREIIAVTPISEVLSDGKSRVEQAAKKLLQETLDSYGAGIRIVLLQLQRVDPPKQVIDSFRDVQTAKADKEKEINQAQAYANDIIPRARGNAAEMQEKALAYKSSVTADAQGEANRFLALYGQYKKAKEVTRKRMYLETMQEVYGDIDKVIIDNKSSNNSLMPYFPLGDLKQTKK